jgi:hypothetical protein
LPNGQGQCCNPFTGQCVSEGGDTPPPPPNPTTPPSVPQGCPSGYLPNGQGMCCLPGTNQCVSEGTGNPPPPPTTTTPVIPQGCPSGYLSNGQGMCCRPGTNDCVSEGSSGGNTGGGNPPNNPTSPFIGCPSGYLPNGQGMCCKPGSDECVQEATPQNGKTWKKVVRVEVGPATNSTQQFCKLIYSCEDWYVCNSYPGNADDCHYSHTNCSSSLECGPGNGDSPGTTPTIPTSPGGSGGTPTDNACPEGTHRSRVAGTCVPDAQVNEINTDSLKNDCYRETLLRLTGSSWWKNSVLDILKSFDCSSKIHLSFDNSSQLQIH